MWQLGFSFVVPNIVQYYLSLSLSTWHHLWTIPKKWTKVWERKERQQFWTRTEIDLSPSKNVSATINVIFWAISQTARNDSVRAVAVSHVGIEEWNRQSQPLSINCLKRGVKKLLWNQSWRSQESEGVGWLLILARGWRENNLIWSPPVHCYSCGKWSGFWSCKLVVKIQWFPDCIFLWSIWAIMFVDELEHLSNWISLNIKIEIKTRGTKEVNVLFNRLPDSDWRSMN